MTVACKMRYSARRAWLVLCAIVVSSAAGCARLQRNGYELRIYQFGEGHARLFEPAFAAALESPTETYDAVYDQTPASERRLSTIEKWALEDVSWVHGDHVFICLDSASRTLFLYNRRSVLDDFEQMFRYFAGGYAFATRIRVRQFRRHTVGESSRPPGRQYRTSDFQFTIQTDGTVAITRYVGIPVTALAIPGELRGRPVSRICDRAFEFQLGFTSVAIPEGVTHIGERAFAECANLRTVSMPDSLLSIGAEAFSGSGLQEVRLGKSVEVIGDRAFAHLSHRTTPPTHVVIPDAVRHIGEKAFFGVPRVSYELGEGLESIGAYAFADSRSVADSLVLPESVRVVRRGALPGIRSVRLGSNVRVVEPNAFPDVAAISVCPRNPVFACYNGALYNNDRTELVQYPSARAAEEPLVFPPGLTAIGPSAFEGNLHLVDIRLPAGVRSIGAFAFADARRLVRIRIGPEVAHIGEGAFVGCENLESIVFMGNAPDVDGDPFEWQERKRLTRDELRGLVEDQRPRWPRRTVVLREAAPAGLTVYRPAGAAGWPRRTRARWHGARLKQWVLRQCPQE